MHRSAWTILIPLVFGFTSTAWAQQRLPDHRTISHVASGGGWKTVMTLVNLSSAAASVTVTFQDDTGLALTLPLVVTQAGASQSQVASEVTRVIAGLATLRIESEAPAASATLTGWADVISLGSFAGFAIFRQRGSDGRDSEGTAPLESTNVAALMVPYDNSDGFSTGIAIVNTGSARVSLVAIVRDEEGIVLGQYGVPMIARSHTAFVVGDRLPASVGRRGNIEVQFIGNTVATSTLTAIGLRFSPAGTFTSVPVVPVAVR